MELPSRMVYDVLISKGVKEIFHANSVITSCQFLRRRALLSRGTVERRGLYQTAQASDIADQRLSIWFDVFVDSVDIHERASRANVYGPVLFVLDTDLIKKSYTGRVWVTKLNPTKWSETKYPDRWFQSISELESDFVKGKFDQMIVFRHSGGEVPIRRFLREIILDDPHLFSKRLGVDYYSMAYGALKLAMTEGGLDVPISKRECSDPCRCKSDYKSDRERTRAMYIPKV